MRRSETKSSLPAVAPSVSPAVAENETSVSKMFPRCRGISCAWIRGEYDCCRSVDEFSSVSRTMSSTVRLSTSDGIGAPAI